MIKHITLLEALGDCSSSCGWCSHHCPDGDKYEMLVSCIQLQNEFLSIGYTVYKILPVNANRVMNKIISLVEILLNELQRNLAKANHVSTLSNHGSDDLSRLPGCSQIFLISQSLGRMYAREFPNIE